MNLPRHLAIIMDGNGRWAQLRRKPRVYGHIRGARVAKDIITECAESGVSFLTLYAFSSENWLRPKFEVSLLMKLFKKYLRQETENLVKKNIRFQVIGDLQKLPLDIVEAIHQTKKQTAQCTGMTLVFAVSYGSQQEITQAVQRIASAVQRGELEPSSIDETLISDCLSTSEYPNPDLVIRTSGEQRLSNFLLWQLAYAELYFSPVLWPDFKIDDLKLAFSHYLQRERRFGGLVNHENASH